MLVRLGIFLRRYLVAVALLATLVVALVQVYATGTGPMPQQPPEGYTVERARASLQWNRGTRTETITLQISIDDPTFSAPKVDRQVNGTSHSLNDLQRGSTYYWRLVQEGQAMLDLCYVEDSSADVDVNVVMNGNNEFIEVQGTAEGATFSRPTLDDLLDLAQKGIAELLAIQQEMLR